MSAGLLVLVALVYGYVAVSYLQSERYGMALAFAAYALSNLGFVLDLRMK